MAVLADLLSRLDDDPIKRGNQFEHICQWFLTHDPAYSQQLRHVWLWRDWPGRWGIDAGIDLVAEDHRGDLWAIQAKAYGESTTITKRDVDTFLAEAGRPQFAFRLMIATTNLIGHTAKRTIKAQEKPSSVLLLGDLEAAQVDWPSSPRMLRAAKPPAKKPTGRWAYQGDAVKAVVRGFEQTSRGQLIMACGTGKTAVALFIHEKLAASRTLVLVPSLSLLSQTLREWTANSKAGFDFLPVCSDETVADPDGIVSNTSDLGFPVTTDPAVIAAFLRRRSGPRVVFATYQSSPQIADAYGLGRVPGFDLVISDEAHRCAGRVSSDFATILSSEKIRAHRRLFMTATPRYFTGRVVQEAKRAEFEVASMDDEEAFGPVFHRLGFAEAIDRELLTDYQVVVVGVDDATYLDWAKRGRFVTLDGTEVIDARTLAGQIGVAKAMRQYDLHRIITFHSRVKRAQEFARELPEVVAWMPPHQRPKGQLWSDYASGEMSAGQRHVLLRHLGQLDQGERGLLANARCLAEGVDVPTLDAVAFIDPRRSEVDIVQAVGRSIRLAAEKTVGTVVIPVFIDTEEDPEIALESSSFKPVWDVIKALRSHDDELGEELDELRRQLGRQRGRPRLPGKIHFDVPARVGVDFARAFDVRLVEQTTASWEFWFGMLLQYVEHHGDALVPQSYDVAGLNLGGWVTEQRSRYVKGSLEPERERRLNLVTGWVWNAVEASWEEGFRRLTDYVEQNGDARVNARYVVEEFKLGNWVNNQRAFYSRDKLRKDRADRLKALPGWSWNPRTDDWEEGFRCLVRYVKHSGSACVPKSCRFDEYNLGAWAAIQRSRYQSGTLSKDRVDRLQQLDGWEWNIYAAKWEEGYRRLNQFRSREGHVEIQQSYNEDDGYRLGTWVLEQRQVFREGRMPKARRKRLESVDGWMWNARDALWEENFRRLRDYVKRHGDARVPPSYTDPEGHKVGQWVKNQKNAFARGGLDAERERRLQGLPGWTWDTTRSASWEEGFTRLQDYVKRHGDTRVPWSYAVGGYKLGSWVSKQRTKHVNGTLEADRQHRLADLPGWIWDTRAASWEEGFTRLQGYVKRHGDARVPQSFTDGRYKLGRWVHNQLYRRGTLDADRQRRLQELPGWTWRASS